MELPTYTAIFTLRRKLYALYDWELPRPVELVQVGVFVIGVAAVWAIARAIGIGFSAASAWAFVVPPAALAWYASQPAADGKALGDWLVSQLEYLFEARRLTVVIGDPTGEPRRAGFARHGPPTPGRLVAQDPSEA